MVGTPLTYKFETQLKKSKQAETRLDKHFAEWFDIAHVPLRVDRCGIDRIFTSRAGLPDEGERYTVEYKCCEKAQSTHNAFVETISVDATNTPGWAYTCQADWLFYYVIGDELVYMLKPETIRKNLPQWEKKYRTRSSQNDGYKTWGICVPLFEFEKAAEQVVCL